MRSPCGRGVAASFLAAMFLTATFLTLLIATPAHARAPAPEEAPSAEPTRAPSEQKQRILFIDLKAVGVEETMVKTIAAIISARLSKQPGIEVILLVRGGGSLEDLWAFNSETVARAIERCPLPVVSGVGHETDLTIADLVADLRAPTPSAAVELSLAARSEVAAVLARDGRRLVAAVRSRLARSRQRLEGQRAALRLLSPLARLAAQRRRLGVAAAALRRAIGLEGERRRGALARFAGQLDSLSPLAVLGRGYALATREQDGGIVRAASELEVGERIDVRLARGGLAARVEELRDETE